MDFMHVSKHTYEWGHRTDRDSDNYRESHSSRSKWCWIEEKHTRTMYFRIICSICFLISLKRFWCDMVWHIEICLCKGNSKLPWFETSCDVNRSCLLRFVLTLWGLLATWNWMRTLQWESYCSKWQRLCRNPWNAYDSFAAHLPNGLPWLGSLKYPQGKYPERKLRMLRYGKFDSLVHGP